MFAGQECLDDKADGAGGCELLGAGGAGHVVLRGDGADHLDEIVEAAETGDDEAGRAGGALNDVEVGGRIGGRRGDGEVLDIEGEQVGWFGVVVEVALIEGAEDILAAGEGLRGERGGGGVADGGRR